MSFSGRPDRVVEACGLAKQRGARVWAVALDEESPLARAADASFGDMGVPIDGAGFQLAHLVLALIAIRVAELRGSIPAAFAGELRAALHGSVADMERTLERCGVAAAEAALASPDAGHVLFLGSGPGYGAAANGAARVVEAAGWNSSALDIEEWAHLNRFVAERRSPSVFIVPPGPSRPRAIEILAAARRLGKPTIVVADERDAELGGWGAYWLPVSTGLPEELCGIVYNLPGEVLANQISIAANRRPYCQDDPLYSQLGEVRWGGYIETTLPRSTLLESRSSGVSSQ
jgi:glucosamine--fructose-6-phosphate aminotransferase (isomerizing)